VHRVFLTGATGFIGGRAAEMLVDRGVEVVCLVRHWGSAARLARLPVQLRGGDVLDAASVRRAMTGCDVVMHCAVDFRTRGRRHRRSSAVGTLQVMRAALDLGISRVVHLSSAAVHGLSPRPGAVREGTLSEAVALRRTGHDYCDGKIAAARAARAMYRRHGLPVVVLRPTIVYGPFGAYSASPARAAREGRLVLVDGAPGICNCLYVDNLVHAMLLAAERPEAVGEVFYIADAEPVTWRVYLERHAGALLPPCGPLPVVSRGELRAARRCLRRAAVRELVGSSIRHLGTVLRDPAIRQGLFLVPGLPRLAGAARIAYDALPLRTRIRVRRLLGAGAPSTLPAGSRAGALLRPLLSRDEELSFAAFSAVRFPIDKARRLLGYQPAVDFEEGMARTAAWIQWARI
jgi:nucleoside-diphosphate-sugar epimerase